MLTQSEIIVFKNLVTLLGLAIRTKKKENEGEDCATGTLVWTLQNMTFFLSHDVSQRSDKSSPIL